MRFRLLIELGDADPGIAWSILSNVRRIPQYWRMMSRFSIFRGGDTYLAEFRFNMRIPLSGGLMRIRTEDGCLVMDYLDWPIRGTVRNCVSDYAITSDWDVRLNPLLLPIYPMVRRRLVMGTRDALRSVVEEALRIQGVPNARPWPRNSDSESPRGSCMILVV
jgi:hypothetical protein